MKVLTVRNVHSALPHAIKMIQEIGVKRDSRNGPVLQAPCPVTTVYEYPSEMVMFWPERDANPFFHLYESLWMLAGRNDVAPLERYVAKSTDYSDDGKTLHGAYGYRWRRFFGEDVDLETGIGECIDQLPIIAEALKKNPTDRRCVLQMWDTNADLGGTGKDHPCNTMATFQRDHEGKLNLVVFNRSNDIIWGCYGANAVQFGTLLEYMANWIDCPVGTYTQVSVNWHAYDNEVLAKIKNLKPDRIGYVSDPYAKGRVHHVPIRGDYRNVDTAISKILNDVDSGEFDPRGMVGHELWADVAYSVLRAHHLYKTNDAPLKFSQALLALGNSDIDWIMAAKHWVQRRYQIWKDKQELLTGGMEHP